MASKESKRGSSAAIRALISKRVSRLVDTKGYTKLPVENLVPGVELSQFESDLRSGSGDELRIKFCAAHSSAALAVNSFAFFKNLLNQLSIGDHTNFTSLRFERQCETGLKGTPPNLDVWLESATTTLAIESKLTEYMTPKKAKYAKSYTRESLEAEDEWWQVLVDSEAADKQYLDVAQLVKHYLGLNRYKSNTEREVKLVYLYWEPSNADRIDICVRHREQIAALESRVRDCRRIGFESMTYTQLWDTWNQCPLLQKHVQQLRDRYKVSI